MRELEQGLLLGLLIGEGHFGGDGRRAQITVRMHSRNRPLLEWLLRVVPGSRLYGPYYHGGRDYCQWMVRGTAPRELVAALDRLPLREINPATHERYLRMKEYYGL